MVKMAHLDTKNWSLFHIIILIPLLFPYSHSKISKRPSRRASFGAPCNSTVKCDIHSLLTCEENVCQCLYQDGMVYNSELGTCLSLVNEVCGYLETKQVFINCISNSVCDHQQGICKCNRGFVESLQDGKCIQQKGYGEPCRSDSECLGDLSLVCFEETCQCEPENYVPYISSNSNIQVDPAFMSSSLNHAKCVSLVGKFCTAKTGCVPKALCISEDDAGGGTVLSSVFGWIHSGICKCEPGYESDDGGYCRGSYGAFCDVLRNISCSDKFQCMDGTCQCKYPDDQVFHEDIGECVSMLDGPCSLSINSSANKRDAFPPVHCDRSLDCKNNSRTGVLTCACKDGFVENMDRGCDLIYGQRCTGGSMSKCDEAADLHCINGFCACKDELRIYDIAAGKCVGKVGSSCRVPPTTKACNDKALKKQPCAGLLPVQDYSKTMDSPCETSASCQLSRAQLSGLASRGVCTNNNGITDADSGVGHLLESGEKAKDDENDSSED